MGASRNRVGFSGYDQNSNDRFINNTWGTIEPINFSLAGTNLGVYAGYDHQFGSVVVGLEADANHTSGASESGRLQEQDNPGNGQWNVSSNWNASLRARAGYLATENVLTYVTAGLAYSNVQTTTGFEVSGGVAQTPPWGFGDIGGGDRLGLTYGGGLEYALSESMTLRTEYRHTDYNSNTIHYLHSGTDATVTNTSNEDRVTVGMSYLF